MLGYGHPDPHLLGIGTAAAPSYAFAGGAGFGNKGMFSRATGALSFAVGGLNSVELQANALYLDVGMTLNWTEAGGIGTGAVSFTLTRDAANVLALKNGTTAQEYRIYGTTTGPKYLSLLHDGTDAKITLTGGGVIRTASIFGIYSSISDANPQSQLQAAQLGFGVGGATALDISLARTTTSSQPSFAIAASGTLTGSPADCPVLALTPTLAGAFTVTRLNYLTLNQPSGAATITDACVLSFNAAVGTHKALASPGAVAVTLGTGPTGANAGNPLGWMKMNINGTIRFTPFW